MSNIIWIGGLMDGIIIHDNFGARFLFLAFPRLLYLWFNFLPTSHLQDEGHEHSSYGAVGHEPGSKKGAPIADSSRSTQALSQQAWNPPLWLQRLSAVLLYYALGCAYYGASPTCQWTPLEVFYFICISIPTIGYVSAGAILAFHIGWLSRQYSSTIEKDPIS
jgi:hypothetical protein